MNDVNGNVLTIQRLTQLRDMEAAVMEITGAALVGVSSLIPCFTIPPRYRLVNRLQVNRPSGPSKPASRPSSPAPTTPSNTSRVISRAGSSMATRRVLRCVHG